MNLAFNLANIHKNMTGINPSVGCLVCKNDKILSYSVTGIGGSPHAEYSALVNLKKNNNLDCYVSLEPCHHQGKNPPCTKSIVNKNVKNLYYSETDNDSRVQGKGLEFLQSCACLPTAITLPLERSIATIDGSSTTTLSL